MRTYEALYIINPELDDNAIQTVVADVEQLITSNGGEIVRSDVWGKRKLAYTIKKHTEGVYVVLRFLAAPDSIRRLEQQLKLTDAIIRYMVLYLDEKTLKLEAEQQQRYEEELRQSAERRGRRDDDDDYDDDDDDDNLPPARRRGRDNYEPQRRRETEDADNKTPDKVSDADKSDESVDASNVEDSEQAVAATVSDEAEVSDEADESTE